MSRFTDAELIQRYNDTVWAPLNDPSSCAPPRAPVLGADAKVKAVKEFTAEFNDWADRLPTADQVRLNRLLFGGYVPVEQRLDAVRFVLGLKEAA